MNASTIPHALGDHLPSRDAATSTITSAVEALTSRLDDLEIADRLADLDVSVPDLHVDLPDLPAATRRSRRAIARVIPGMSTGWTETVRSRTSGRRLAIVAIVVIAVVTAILLRRRTRSGETGQQRDDWTTAPVEPLRPNRVEEREPVTAAR